MRAVVRGLLRILLVLVVLGVVQGSCVALIIRIRIGKRQFAKGAGPFKVATAVHQDNRCSNRKIRHRFKRLFQSLGSHPGSDSLTRNALRGNRGWQDLGLNDPFATREELYQRLARDRRLDE